LHKTNVIKTCYKISDKMIVTDPTTPHLKRVASDCRAKKL